MNPLLSDENVIEQFESYRSGMMAPEVTSGFAHKLNNEPEWKEAYRIFLLTRDVIGEKISDDLKTQLQTWNAETLSGKESAVIRPIVPGHVRRKNPVFRIALAASILFLLAFGFMQYREINRYPDLAISEYQGIKSKSDRGEATVSKVDQIIEGYLNQSQSIDQTISALKQIPPDVPGIDYFKAQNYLGRLYLKLGDCNPMGSAYQNSASLTGYKYDGDIAQVLCAMKNGSTPAEISVYLKKILDNPEHTYYDQALEMNKKVHSAWWSLFK